MIVLAGIVAVALFLVLRWRSGRRKVAQRPEATLSLVQAPESVRPRGPAYRFPGTRGGM